MFLADGGPVTPRAAATNTTTPSGPHKLKIDPSAIPEARKLFEKAMNDLRAQLQQATYDLQARNWAGDPVSKETAQKFNQHTFDGADAAIQALTGYHNQLKAAHDALLRSEQQYTRVEGDNAALWGRSQRA
ncbi:transcriptional regulator [Gandjariella thermophila]|uniref:Uncharacterized protein n=1 Tax=Gandjariella thermophila TaxID=1931992 RepID=A0A4D4J607_9PSEU|nr:transcriptional regulator [Gandjariella thermophila]GDY32145.1 hypothetical protein GTS_37780 [Gandjariella thermophila]